MGTNAQIYVGLADGSGNNPTLNNGNVPISGTVTANPNAAVSLIASASYTTTQSSADQTNAAARRLLLYVSISSAGTGSVTPSIQVKDSISGNYKTVWTAGAALVATADSTYYFADGAVSTGGSFTAVLGFGLPGVTWKLVMTANNANAMTYSVSAQPMQ